jgi:hypothetical protein
VDDYVDWVTLYKPKKKRNEKGRTTHGVAVEALEAATDDFLDGGILYIVGRRTKAVKVYARCIGWLRWLDDGGDLSSKSSAF